MIGVAGFVAPVFIKESYSAVDDMAARPYCRRLERMSLATQGLLTIGLAAEQLFPILFLVTCQPNLRFTLPLLNDSPALHGPI